MLTWQAPIIVKERITDDFEAYDMESYEHFGFWATYDGDDGGTYRVKEFGDYPGAGDLISWILFNTDNADGKIEAHSGKQMLFTVSANYFDAMENANWLMSPQLSGDEQKISFWYRVLDTKSPEVMRILYSYNSNHYEDFIALDTVADMTNSEWLEYTTTIPEGAKYFAVEYISPTLNPVPFAMMIDDVSYEGIGQKLEVAGYNIYRDGQLVATVGKDVLSWTDEDAGNTLHTYTVTVSYTVGESTYSNKVVLNPAETGINGTAVSEPRLLVAPGQITITHAEGLPVVITTVDGKQLLQANGDATAQVDRGCYIVRIGKKTTKVLVP